MTTLCPAALSAVAIAKPIPRFPPVTSAIEVGSLMRENYPTVALWLKKMTFTTSLAPQKGYLLTSLRDNVAISFQ